MLVHDSLGGSVRASALQLQLTPAVDATMLPLRGRCNFLTSGLGTVSYRGEARWRGFAFCNGQHNWEAWTSLWRDDLRVCGGVLA